MELSDDIEVLKGVGPKKAQQLHGLGLCSLFDLLTHFPRSYEDQSSITPIGRLEAGERATVAGVITGLQEKRAGRRGMVILTATISDGTGFLQLTWFNQKFLKQKLKTGRRIFASGRTAYAYGGQGQLAMSQMTSFEIVENEGADMEAKCGILPVYSAGENVKQSMLRALTEQLLGLAEAGELAVPEVIPEGVRQQYGLLPRLQACRQIHYPEDRQQVEKARYRLAFEELYLIQYGLMLLKKRRQERQQGIRFASCGSLTGGVLSSLPFRLTDDQQNAWQDICNDMERPVPMRRLVQGDVGSGKTVIAMLALVKAVENGFQGAMMAPTEILARQHFESFSGSLEPLGIRVALLSGRLTKKAKQEMYDRLAAHEIDIVIGTHALIQEDVSFANLGLVVTDEQHRFGINQRAVLEKKGNLVPDVLVMTATPIPRTLTLTVYGDLEVSLIRQLPPGRKPVRTFVRGRDRRELIYKFVLEEIKKGRQAYVVCPLIEMNEDSGLSSAQEVYEELTGGIFYGVKCGLVHGKLKQKEKEELMQEFYEGKIKLLVATTVIEVGVNVPNASIMVVENAQRFGLAQLHQLRGRIGRGEYASYCIFVAEERTEAARQRMEIMERTTDGFVLAEEDLKLRGPGQFFGSMQHGLPDLKIADVGQDIDILLRARQAAMETVKGGEGLPEVLAALQLQYREQFFNITEN
ncbi:ATP-dependent DNA helicase RecG [Veillonellaceae bacterium WCA-693-APC-5D-A]|uniref:ATP-dependent DNA helicase RecG n=1 Tax=Anaerovibrio slackiae TaxID=2652309 RepID=A0A6I2UDX3_9FIRM|nr:ATP-dependent DNA helicase RecG [Anaerovibrio slackiae]MSU09768.1 ATP-dependent DNA helicase RecG [Anaerovibrio slackiae]